MSDNKFNPTRPVDLYGPTPHLDRKKETAPTAEIPPSPEEPIDFDNDPELKALDLMMRALTPLALEARRRVLQWAADRFQ